MNKNEAIEILWDYLQLNQSIQKSDLILVPGSRDDRTAKYASELYLQGYGKYLLFSGGVSYSNDSRFDSWQGKTEAEHFADIASQSGITSSQIILENKATNTGQNIKFSFQLIKDLKLNIKSIIIVQKPYMEKRCYATYQAQWPDKSVQLSVTSPKSSFKEYINDINSEEDTINLMVGDTLRIIEYPKHGFQIPMEVPVEVVKAMNLLIDLGYNKRLIVL